MIRRTLAVMVLGLWLAGCAPQEVRLIPEEVATLEAKLGDLTKADNQALLAEVQRMLDSTVEKIDVAVSPGGAKVTATLPPAGSEILEKSGTTLWDAVSKNPTTTGIVGGGLAAIAIAWRVLAKRKALSNRGG